MQSYWQTINSMNIRKALLDHAEDNVLQYRVSHSGLKEIHK